MNGTDSAYIQVVFTNMQRHDKLPLCTCHLNDERFEFYLRLNITKSNERKRAFTAVDVATSDDAEEKMFGH